MLKEKVKKLTLKLTFVCFTWCLNAISPFQVFIKIIRRATPRAFGRGNALFPPFILKQGRQSGLLHDSISLPN